MESEQFSLSWNNFHNNLSAGFHSLLQDEDLVDVTLAAEGQYLKAHKTILSVCSPYFKELFRVNPCKHPIVILQDVNYTALKNLLQFMYYGEVSVSQEEIPIFMRVAETLKVKGLTDTGSNGFLERITEHTETRTPEKLQKPSKKVIKHVQSRSTESPHSSYSSHPSESPRLVKSPEPTPAKRMCTEETNSTVKATINPKEEPVEQNEEYTDMSYDDSLDMSSMLNTSIMESPHPSGSWVPPNQTQQSTTDTSSPGGLLFMKSRRGHPVVIHNGHIYTLYQKYESRTTWQCVKRRVFNCSGCIITTNGPMVLSYSGHNHPQLNDVIQRLHAPACSSSLPL